MTTPNDIVRLMFEHHLWATRRLIDHLEGLSPERLDESMPGTYGPMLQTLTHLVDADDRYLQRMSGRVLGAYVDRGEVSLATLRRELDDHEARWNGYLRRLDEGSLRAAITGRGDEPDIPDAEGLLLLQAVHHGNDHRTQICSTLGALGEAVPDLDGWTFWDEGRS
jgi:uncharacterized damage-inducible protein DinB